MFNICITVRMETLYAIVSMHTVIYTVSYYNSFYTMMITFFFTYRYKEIQSLVSRISNTYRSFQKDLKVALSHKVKSFKQNAPSVRANSKRREHPSHHQHNALIVQAQIDQCTKSFFNAHIDHCSISE